MGFLDVLSKAAPGINAVTGIAGGVVSALTGTHKQRKMARYQQKLQMELNEQQQKFARENAQTDYERQRALVRDNASLERQGRMNAGLSLAGDFGNGSASAPTTASPTAGSAPSLPDPNQNLLAGISTVQSSINDLIQNNVSQSVKEYNDSKTRRQNIENMFAIQHEMTELDNMKKSGKISEVEYAQRKEELKRALDTHDSFVTQQTEVAKQSAFETKIKEIQVDEERVRKDILDITSKLNKEQLKQAEFITKHQLQKFMVDLEEQYSRIKANYSSAQAALSAAALNASQKFSVDIQNALDKEKIPYAGFLASKFAEYAGNQVTGQMYHNESLFLDNKRLRREGQFYDKAREFESTPFGSFYVGARIALDNGFGSLFK